MQQLKIGSSLQGGKYKIEKVLGQGGFGITYLATQQLLDRKVCIKEFFFKEYCERNEATSHVSLGTQSNHELVERFMTKFLKEARIISQFEHRNIIKVLDIFKENNTAYYVMDYVEGESLNEMVNRRGALPEKEAVAYIERVADALKYIHDKNINHLDIKPSNIMIRKGDLRVILIDFGLSKQYDEQGSQTSTTPMGISHGYAPMEQYKQGGVSTFSPQTDIYSLGATLYKLVTGQTPPQASDVLNDGLPELPTSLTSEVKNAINQAMQVRKKDRPEDVRAFLYLMDISNSVVSNEETKVIQTQPKQEEDEATMVLNKPEIKEKVYSSRTFDDRPKPTISFEPEDKEGKKKSNKVGCSLIIILGCFISFLILRNCNGNESGQTSMPQSTKEQNMNHQNVNSGSKIGNNSSTTLSVSTPKDSYGICNVEKVDLGLSIKWAGWNVGTGTAEGYGGLYQPSDVPMSGWQSGWRLPTSAEIDELRERCKWSWINYKGVRGMKVVGPNGNAIFLPASGIREENKMIVHRGLYGGYWSSDLSASTTGGSYFMEFDDFEGKTDEDGYPLMAYGYYRYLDKSVRLVHK